MAHSGHEGKAKGRRGYPDHYFARHSLCIDYTERTHSECTLVTLSRTTRERRSQGIDPGAFDRAIPPERVVPWRARGQLCSVLFPRGRPGIGIATTPRRNHGTSLSLSTHAIDPELYSA